MNYQCLKKQTYSSGQYSIVPLRYEDRFAIMKWRNEQIFHLRQSKLLEEADQEKYFSTAVKNGFTQEEPAQVLFSYLENDICIGYGGLVHINRQDKYAEISFLINTALEEENFEKHWLKYLSLIEEPAFGDLGLHKIFTYAFDLRPLLYDVLIKAGFKQEARLKEHCLFEGKFIDVLIHSKINDHAHIS